MKKLTEKDKQEITIMCQEFASGFEDRWPTINGTGWFIVDPFAALLQMSGYKVELQEMPVKEDRPQVLIMVFEDGSKFIPAGGDLSTLDPAFKNWMWF